MSSERELNPLSFVGRGTGGELDASSSRISFDDINYSSLSNKKKTF